MTIKYEYNDELARDTFWEMFILKTNEKQGNLKELYGRMCTELYLSRL